MIARGPGDPLSPGYRAGAGTIPGCSGAGAVTVSIQRRARSLLGEHQREVAQQCVGTEANRVDAEVGDQQVQNLRVVAGRL